MGWEQVALYLFLVIVTCFIVFWMDEFIRWLWKRKR